ncbi:MAG: DUF4263 domain-containing protein [Ignavibacteria bacterium]|nr:DUF4263 domain-containing protein [Ignavibacteria bacterium]
MEEYKVVSTSRNSAECDEIVLRTTSKSRLAFKPIIVNNERVKNASIKGYFVYQKKNDSGEWLEYKDLNLSDLQKGHWIKLEIKSEELLHLVKDLIGLYKIHRKEGVPYGKTTYLKAEESLNELSKISEEDLKNFFTLNKKAGINVFSQLLNFAVKMENAEQVVDKLEKLEINSLQRLNSLIGLSNLKKNLETWKENEFNSDEEFWQSTFLNNSFLLSQIFSFPIVVIKGKAYVGGKTFENIGGNFVDFLCKNSLSQNAVLIEIKTPTTKLLGDKYRSIYNVSEDLSGSLLQISNYRYLLNKNFISLNSDYENELSSFHPQCVIIAGNISKELQTEKQRKSFELFRQSLKDVQILSYDELFKKVESLVSLFEEGN